ncbi:hypothetical protein BT93_E0180 [Corymbia citriodora subsp. variegata]|nr:hypothetical protein BT93_E0180 [Corymbia citriodora subsp. variegata]
MAEPRSTVGYALLPKKQGTFIQDSLLAAARSRGIDLVAVDLRRPLADQGPFDCVLHKLSGEDWIRQLREFSSRHPGAAIVDPPDAIERLHNRISMLQVVSGLEIECPDGSSFATPHQVVVHDRERLLSVQSCEGLAFPVIAKPLVANGSELSHEMYLVLNRGGLSKLEPPIVLQEFVNHSGVVFKVYVVGEYVQCVKRTSLPDVPEERLGCPEGLMPFSQVSNTPIREKDGDESPEATALEEAEMPPRSLIAELARGLRRAMKLNLFNFDVIRDARNGDRFLVIDINYFPGYFKMPGYETALTDFLWDVVHKKEKDEVKYLEDENCPSKG